MSDAKEFVRTSYGKVRYELQTNIAADKLLYVEDGRIKFSEIYSRDEKQFDEGNKVHQIARKSFEKNLANCIGNTFDQMLQLKIILESAGITDFTEIMEAELARFFAACYDGAAKPKAENAEAVMEVGDER